MSSFAFRLSRQEHDTYHLRGWAMPLFFEELTRVFRPLITRLDCESCNEMSRILAGRSWRQVPSAQSGNYCGGPSFRPPLPPGLGHLLPCRGGQEATPPRGTAPAVSPSESLKRGDHFVKNGSALPERMKHSAVLSHRRDAMRK